MGKVQGLEVQPRPGIHGLPVGPKPLAQPPALPPQDPGQWAGEGGVILYPSHQPPELLCWGIPVKYLCLYWGTGKHWGLPERKQAGPSPSLRPGLWRPLPWGRCQAGAQECGFPSAHTLGGEAEQPTPTGSRVEAGEDRPGCWAPSVAPQDQSTRSAGPHLCSLPGQGTGRGTGLVCPRTGREELRSQRLSGSTALTPQTLTRAGTTTETCLGHAVAAYGAGKRVARPGHGHGGRPGAPARSPPGDPRADPGPGLCGRPCGPGAPSRPAARRPPRAWHLSAPPRDKQHMTPAPAAGRDPGSPPPQPAHSSAGFPSLLCPPPTPSAHLVAAGLPERLGGGHGGDLPGAGSGGVRRRPADPERARGCPRPSPGPRAEGGGLAPRGRQQQRRQRPAPARAARAGAGARGGGPARARTRPGARAVPTRAGERPGNCC